eukprot:4417273-Pleurochrysis_carterae.AAC.1
MCLPWERRPRACRSLCRIDRVAIKTREFEAMRRSTGFFALQSSDSADAGSLGAVGSGTCSTRRATVGNCSLSVSSACARSESLATTSCGSRVMRSVASVRLPTAGVLCLLLGTQRSRAGLPRARNSSSAGSTSADVVPANDRLNGPRPARDGVRMRALEHTTAERRRLLRVESVWSVEVVARVNAAGDQPAFGEQAGDADALARYASERGQ